MSTNLPRVKFVWLPVGSGSEIHVATGSASRTNRVQPLAEPLFDELFGPPPQRRGHRFWPWINL